jgi:hypothetical protein
MEYDCLYLDAFVDADERFGQFFYSVRARESILVSMLDSLADIIPPEIERFHDYRQPLSIMKLAIYDI